MGEKYKFPAAASVWLVVELQIWGIRWKEQE